MTWIYVYAQQGLPSFGHPRPFLTTPDLFNKLSNRQTVCINSHKELNHVIGQDGRAAPTLPYERHRPEKTLLYQLIKTHYPKIRAYLEGDVLLARVEGPSASVPEPASLLGRGYAEKMTLSPRVAVGAIAP